MTVDLFLIDWEQPKPGSVNERNTSGQINPKTGVNSTKDMAVSVWRTYSCFALKEKPKCKMYHQSESSNVQRHTLSTA